MKRLRADKDIKPLSEFRANATACIQHVTESKRPLVITQHGRSSVVVLDVAEYEALLDRLEMLEDLQASETDLKEGRTLTHREARREALRRLAR
jgi:prevent-host-death family protein